MPASSCASRSRTSPEKWGSTSSSQPRVSRSPKARAGARCLRFTLPRRRSSSRVDVRNSDRFDQIYGDDFEYDQQAGTVVAQGKVHIDLEGNTEGQKVDDQAPPHEMQNPIHLQAEGMIFNQKTGIAETVGTIEFRVPQAAGTAQGATYDSKKNELTLHSAIDIQTEAPTRRTFRRSAAASARNRA